MWKIPDKLTLFGFDIKTLYDPTLLADRERFGEYCSRQMTNTLDSNLSEQRSKLAFCHETVEAIIDINHLPIEDEQTKQAIGIGIYQILNQMTKGE